MSHVVNTPREGWATRPITHRAHPVLLDAMHGKQGACIVSRHCSGRVSLSPIKPGSAPAVRAVALASLQKFPARAPHDVRDMRPGSEGFASPHFTPSGFTHLPDLGRETANKHQVRHGIHQERMSVACGGPAALPSDQASGIHGVRCRGSLGEISGCTGRDSGVHSVGFQGTLGEIPGGALGEVPRRAG